MIRKETIAFVGPCPPPLGGVAVTNLNFQRLVSGEYELEIFDTSSGRERENLYAKKGLREIVSTIRVIFTYLGFIVKCRSKCVNIFVTSNLAFFRDIFFIVFAKTLNKNVIVHLHSKKQGELFLGKFSIRILSFFVNMADSIFLLSKDHEEYFKKYFNSAKTFVFENFVFDEDFKPRSKRVVKEFIFVGRLTREKGFYDLVDSVSFLSTPIAINVLGAAETEEADSALRKYVQQKGVENSFRFYGSLKGPDKYAVFHRSAIMLFPSHFENSPVVLKEGLAAEQVIISSDIPANKNVLEGSDCVIYFEVNNPQSLAKAIGKVVDNDSQFERYSGNAKCPERATAGFAKKAYFEIINSFFT